MATNAAWNKTLVSASGAVLGQGVEFGGAFVSAAGTNTTVTAYDAATATGDPVIPTTATLTVGQYIPPAGGLALNVTTPANGIKLTTGLYVSVGGTGSPKIYVLWR